MQVKVEAYYTDGAMGKHQTLSVLLDSEDGQQIFEEWDTWSHRVQYKKLLAAAEIYTISGSVDQGFRDKSIAQEQIKKIMVGRMND